MKETTYL